MIIKLKILDLGCGTEKIKYPNAKIVGLDIVKYPNVDVVHDLHDLPLPFKNEEFDIVHASHVLEHIEKNKTFFKLMNEIYRILKPNGIFLVRVPYWKSFIAYGNPEHTRFFSSMSFDYFDHSIERRFSKCNFQVLEKKFNLIFRGRLRFLNVLNWIFNTNTIFTEKILSNIFAPEEIIFKLKKVVSNG